MKQLLKDGILKHVIFKDLDYAHTHRFGIYKLKIKSN